MAGLDWKHVVSAILGIVLGVVGAYFGIDFSKSCPPAPVLPAAIAPAVVK